MLLKRETYSGPISFEVQWNNIWTDNIQSFYNWDAILVQQHWELELVTESQLKEVQMNTPLFLGPELSEKFTINLVAKCKGKDVLASYMWTASILWNSIVQIMLNSANCMGRLFALHIVGSFHL